jgi:Fe-Mn family superoxide dismutase
MDYQAKNYEKLLGVAGFSDQLLNNHFTLYNGYVTNTNKITEALWSLVKEEKTVTPEFAELKRRGGWEWNGMRLHELYFENLTKESSALTADSALYQKLDKFFDSFETWQKLFKATGAMRGIGWVVLYYDAVSNNFFNVWINEHDAGHFAGATPLLVMDVFEHAYMLDYQLKKADYIEAFFRAIDWRAVEARLK